MKKMKNALKIVGQVLGDAFNGWNMHKAPRMGGALAYYTVFSIGPLLMICVAIAGVIFGADAASNQIFETLRGMVGDAAAAVIQSTVKAASKPSTSILATSIGIFSLIFGATGVFGELHDALNTIWGVKAKELKFLQNIWGVVKDRLLSFTMVLGTGFLLLTSLVVTAGLSVLGKWLSSTLPGGEFVWQVINFIIAQGIIGLIFTAILMYVPDVKMGAAEGLIGGFVTGLLFNLGKLGIGLYIGKADVASAFGAAGSIIILLVWIYFSSQILYFGAELSRAVANALHHKVTPRRAADKVLIDESIPDAAPQGAVKSPVHPSSEARRAG